MKKHYQTPLLIAGVLTGGVTVLVLVNQHKKSQDTLMQGIYHELTKLFNPLAQGLDGEKAFDINLLGDLQAQGLTPVYTMDSFYLRKAKELHGAFGRYGYNDDEAKINAILTGLPDKVAISQVAKQFQREYTIRLKDKLRKALDSQEVTQLLSNIRNMKTYRPK